MTTYAGVFARCQLRGRNWIATLPPEDRAAWADLGRMAQRAAGIDWHRLGGQQRAKHAQRDRRGRFVASIPF